MKLNDFQVLVYKKVTVSRFRERSQETTSLFHRPCKSLPKKRKNTHVLLINIRLKIEYQDNRFAAPLIHSGRLRKFSKQTKTSSVVVCARREEFLTYDVKLCPSRAVLRLRDVTCRRCECDCAKH